MIQYTGIKILEERKAQMRKISDQRLGVKCLHTT